VAIFKVRYTGIMACLLPRQSVFPKLVVTNAPLTSTVWGLSLAIKHYHLDINGLDLASLVASNWLCMTLTHSAFCTWEYVLEI
jgi:hypothetical protein